MFAVFCCQHLRHWFCFANRPAFLVPVGTTTSENCAFERTCVSTCVTSGFWPSGPRESDCRCPCRCRRLDGCTAPLRQPYSSLDGRAASMLTITLVLHWWDTPSEPLGLIHTDVQCDAKQMEPACVNGSVHTARKQHQRVCIRICASAFCVDEVLTALCSLLRWFCRQPDCRFHCRCLDGNTPPRPTPLKWLRPWRW